MLGGKKYLIFFSALVSLLVITGAGCVQFGGNSAGPMGVFQSVNKGDTWQPRMSYPTLQGVKSMTGVKVFRLHNDPSDPDAWYLASRGQGLFYTYNNGESWQAFPALNGKFIYGLAIDPKDKCNLYVSDGPHIYKSTDCGRFWKLTYTEERPNQRLVALAVDYGDSQLIYGALLGGDIIVSSNGGTSWQVTKRFGFDLQYLVADPFVSKRVYVAAYSQGLYRSDDKGNNWTDLSGGLGNFSGSSNFYRLILNPGQRDSLFWISKYGILRSDDAGATWSDLKLLTPPGSVDIYAFAINPKNQKEIYYTGTILGEKDEHVRSTFYKSVDGGTNWVTKKLPTNTIPTQLFIHPKNAGTLLMGFTVLN